MSATTLSDDEEIARTSVFCRVAEMDFQRLAGPRNVSIDLKYIVLGCYFLKYKVGVAKHGKQ